MLRILTHNNLQIDSFVETSGEGGKIPGNFNLSKRRAFVN